MDVSFYPNYISWLLTSILLLFSANYLRFLLGFILEKLYSLLVELIHP